MCKLVIIKINGVAILDDSEENCRTALLASMQSTFTIYAFLYKNSELIETYIPRIN